MENSEKRLVQLMSDISLIYVLSKEDQSLQKKFEHYQNANVLIPEAKKLIDDLQSEVYNLDMSKVDKSHTPNAKKLADLLTTPNLNFKEVAYIVKELKQMANGLPTTANVNDNMEKEVVIYEEQDVDA